MKQLRALVFVVLGLNAISVQALEPWVPTDTEMMSLPPFCKVKMKAGPGSEEYKQWESMLGPDFMHTHHYCAGLNFINRFYRAKSELDKGFNIGSAKNNLQYMVDHAAPTYSLMPDVYLNLGIVNVLGGEPAKAITHFEKAISLNPRVARPYGELANIYEKLKDRARALDVVSGGLRHNPDAKGLQRRYAELGGKLPYPQPITDDQPVKLPEAASEKLKVSEPVIVTTPVVKVEPAAPVSESALPAKTGAAKNPYCRFCPE